MTIRGFDVATAGFILSLIVLILVLINIFYSIESRQRLNRVEASMRGWCAGDTKPEVCAQIDLPLNLDKFKK